MEDIKKIQEFFSKPLEENTTDWPKEVPSRHGDIIFRLVKVMPDRAKYELIDAGTGKTWEVGGRVYGTVNQLKASAEDTIKPQGGRQSSQFESVNEAKKKLPKFKNIPSWAKYVAQASDGEWTWYEDIPTMIKFKDGGGAWKQDGNQTYTGVKTNGKDWDKIPTYYNVKNGVITESVNESPDVNSLKKIHDAVLKFLKTKKGVGEVKEFPEFPNRYGDNVSTFSVKYNIEDKYNYDLQEIKIEYSTSRVFIPNKGYFPFKTFNDIKNIINKKSSLKESVNENLNPEVSNAVSRFIKAMAKRYDYSEQDAVYAIQAALKQRDFNSVNESIEKDPIDTITMDVPLFIRVLEYAREDAQADMDLHDLAEKAISATKQQGILQMDDYDMLVGSKEPMNKLTVAEKVIAQLKEEKPGLWANIRAKKARGEKPAHGNSDAHKTAVKAGKKINKLNEDEEDQFSAELDGFADQLAAEIKDELEDHKEDIQKSDKELNEIVGVVGIIGYILLSNTVANMLSKFAKKQFAKRDWGKGEAAAKKIYDFTHKNEEAFKAPIKRIVGLFTKDEKKKTMISDILYAIVVLAMAGQAGGDAVGYIKKAGYIKAGLYGLKAAVKGTEVAQILKGVVADAVS